MMITIVLQLLTIGIGTLSNVEGRYNQGRYVSDSHRYHHPRNNYKNLPIQPLPGIHRAKIGTRTNWAAININNDNRILATTTPIYTAVSQFPRGGAGTRDEEGPTSRIPTTGKKDYSYYDVGGVDDVMDTRPDVTDDKVLVDSGIDYDHLIDGAYGWLCNLGAPSALVAGAVIASIYENMNNPDSNYQPNYDTKITGFAKKLVRWLLITAFACEALCIFISTVTGTMLLSEDLDSMLHQGIVRTAKTPLQFLHDHFEFEYITGHIMFLQGLLNWFTAIAVSHAIPTMNNSPSTTAINQFLAIILLTTTVFMLSVYNKHIYFYPNYGTMLYRWFHLVATRFVVWPPRPLSFILFPSLILSIAMGIKVFLFHDNHNSHNDNHNNNKIEDTTSKQRKAKV